MARRLWIMTFVASVAAVSPAHAHRFEHPKVLRLGVRSGRVLIDVRSDVNPGDAAARLRALFDRNADGALDAGEREKLAGYLYETATLFLKLSVDGAEARLERLEMTTDGLDRPTGASESLGMSALLSAALPTSGVVRLGLEDRPRDAAEHVPVTIDLGPGVEVELSTQGELFPDVRQIREVQLKEGSPLSLQIRFGGRTT